MKKIFLIMTAVLLTANLFAQAPQKMSYQAVIRNASNTLITNTTVGMRLSILQGSEFGASVYVETQTPITNTNGLVSLEIGNGIVILGTFSSIDWSNGPYFIKTETDPNGGSAYSITGVSQLMSVPYALFSANSINYIAGSGISIVGNTISNSLPDQSISLTGTGGTTVTGSYPTFIVSTPKIIRGTSSGGFAPTTINGGGFTVVRTNTGTYTITFSTPFTNTPTAVTSIHGLGFTAAQIEVTSTSLTTMVIKTYNVTSGPNVVLVDNIPFSFIAIGD